MDCWDLEQCAGEYRSRCPAYLESRGFECWRLTGTMCDAGRLEMAGIEDKRRFCRECEFYRKYAKKY